MQISVENFDHKSLSAEEMIRILQFSLWRLEGLNEWSRDGIEKCFQDLANKLGLKIRDFLFPLFVAITGNAISISVIEYTAILGIDITRSRLRQAIALLGGVSKKAAKNLEKEFKALG